MIQKKGGIFVVDIRELVNYCIPSRLKENILKLDDKVLQNINEIRIRADKPMIFISQDEDFFITYDGKKTEERDNLLHVSSKELLEILNLICNNSLYAYMDTLKSGFVTLKGGHRVGITGKVVVEDNKIKNIKEISSVNIRIARQIKGLANNIIKYIVRNEKDIYNTLIIAPPACGKTTLLRDIIRIISDGSRRLNQKGLKVCIIDERSEIASLFKGVPQNDVGIRSDILDGCSKSEGIMLALRSMSPQVIATDEIGTSGDFKALQEVINCGVRIITTAHGFDIKDIERRNITKSILNERIFDRFIILGKDNKVGKLKDILDENRVTLLQDKRQKCS